MGSSDEVNTKASTVVAKCICPQLTAWMNCVCVVAEALFESETPGSRGAHHTLASATLARAGHLARSLTHIWQVLDE